ncbi:unnamed protein product [Paramecium sonneborni]|uniref:Uncharacterized protein n=1 Tax=Paramecium sonneborni TaxID=65129 RepID=A0A8S1PJZ9_9CILI|nr:unnamed protein product [Paramecium sonneborni]
MQSSNKRLSNDITKPNIDQFKQILGIIKIRPSSAKLQHTIKQQPLALRKATFSGVMKNRLKNDINNVEQQLPVSNLEKNIQYSSQASLTLKQNQQQLQQNVRINQTNINKTHKKYQKPPLPLFDKDIIIKKQELLLNSENCAMTGETKSKNNNSQQKIQRAGANINKFTQYYVGDQQEQRQSSLNKIEIKKDIQITQNITSNFHQQQQIIQPGRIIKQNYNPEINNLPILVNNKEPLCYTDFSMASRPQELPIAFALIKKEIQQASLYAKQFVIPEQKDEGLLQVPKGNLKKFK